jgi:hypothetical protein
MDTYRRTGRSTRQALGYIIDCLNNPRRTYHIVDHFGTRNANVCLLNTIEEMVDKLHLVGFQFNQNTVSMRYDVQNLRGR